MTTDRPVWGARAQTLRQALSMAQAYDLLLVVTLGIIAPLLLWLPIPLIRIPIGLVIALLLPGYVLLAALYPRRQDLDIIDRFALSIGASVALLPLMALLLDRLPWGIRPLPIALTLAIWLVSIATVAAWRRARLVPHMEAGLPPSPAVLNRRWKQLGRRRWPIIGVGIALIVCLTGVGMLIGDVYRAPEPTAFYAVGSAGLMQDYPRQTVVGQSVEVTIGVGQSTTDDANYRVEIWVVDPSSSERQELLERTASFEVAAGQRVERSLTWRMPHSGDDRRVDIILLRGNDTTPYRSLILWLNVREPN